MKTRLALTMVLSALGVGCGAESEEAGPTLRMVRTVVVAGDDGARQRIFSGVAQAGEQSRLSFQVTGRVQEVPAKVGRTVGKGDTIAKLDPADYQLQLQNAKASSAQARALERNAKATYDRTRALYENQNASKQDLDAAQTQYQSSRASLSSANQQVQLLKRQLDYAHLRAPAAGTITSVDVEPNENVTAGQQIATLQIGEQIEVSVAIPESAIADIKEGSTVQVSFDALDGKPFEGKAVEVGVAAAQGSTTFPVTVRLQNGQESVRAGMAANVVFEVANKSTKPKFRVPVTAVGEDRDGRFVFTVKRGDGGLGSVHRRAVTIGEMTGDGIEIAKGVGAGDEVVTAGVSRIYDGLKVRVPSVEPVTEK